MNNFTLLTFIILSYFISFAQPVNDACTNPTLINNVSNFCSANAAGTTVNATDDAITGTTYSAPTCWGTGAVNDVYFSFVAIATDVTIVINGNQGSPVGGTLNRPQVALYTGGCGGSELVCQSAPSGQNIVQIYRGGLTIGQTYLIRVDGFNTNKGTFQYCVNNYNQIPNPQSDCLTDPLNPNILCNMSSFTVPNVGSAGNNPTEMNGAACFQYSFLTGNVETNSVWYKFTFQIGGTFNFNITPSNPGDDIDFALYRLPAGLNDCNNKVLLRCMASSCVGATGLNTSSTDTEEPPGCSFPQNNFVSQINVTSGQTYAIAINNFTSTGNGFNMSFGGTAQIQGPVALINDNDADDLICVGEAITYVDASSAPPAGSLVSWVWNFGVGATPATFTGTSPPPVTYSTVGIKTITLTVKSDKGCLVTSTKSITVNGVVSSVSIVASQNNVCANTNIVFTATPTNGGSNPSYQWYKNGILIPLANGATYSSNSLLNNDKIKVVMTSNALCATGSPATSNEITMNITPGTLVSVSLAVDNNNICSGIAVTFTATPSSTTLFPTYKWYKNSVLISGATGATYTSSTLANNDIITVEMTSNVACISGSPANSNAIVMIINSSPTITVNSPTICNGNTTTIIASGATTYLWSTGETGNSISVNPNSTTTYSVVGTTAGCKSASVSAFVTVSSIPIITVNSPTICNGNSTTLTATGAATYSWSNGASGNTITVNPTTTTNYTVIGTTNTCPSLPKTATVTVNTIPTVNVNSPTICSGNPTTLTATGATTYSWSNGATGNTITVNPTITTTYTVVGTTNTCPSLPITSTVTVNATPVITVNSPSICNGNSTTLTATGATTYSWSNGATGNTITVNPTTTTNYTVIGTTNTCPSLPKTATVTVNVTPVITVNSPTICNGNTTTLTATGATTYSWSNGSTGNSISVNPTTTTTYTVVGTTNNCPSLPNTSTVTVNNVPNINVNSATICNGNSTTLTATGATTYSWSNGSTGNSITVNPTTTTNYTVIGTTNNCPSLPKTAIVTVNATPIITVNSDTICIGNSSILTASGATTYVWSNGSTGNSITVNPSITTNYTVVGTINGCPSLPKTASVNVNTTPPVVTVNSPTICSGNSVTLTASGATTYLWNTGATTATISVNPTSNTTYTVIGRTLSCNSLLQSAVVTVNPKPIISVTSDTICNGASTTLTASGATSYSWSNGATGNSIIVNPTTTTNYTVIGTTLSCPSIAKIGQVVVNQIPIVTVNSATICAGNSATLTASGATTYLWNTGQTSASISVSPNLTVSYTVVGNKLGCNSLPKNTIVNVNPIPVINVNSPTICSGKQATLTANGATNYTWSNGVNSNSIIVNPTSNTTYSVTGTSLNCPSQQVNAIVTVNATPTITVNSETICVGETAILTAIGANSFNWSNGANGTSISVNPSISTIYTVTGTTLNCPSSPINSVVTVSTSLIPNVSIVANKNNICSGTPITFTATTTGTSNIQTYQWYVNSIPVGTNNRQLTISTLNNGDIIYVEINTTFRCSQPKTARSNSIAVIVNKINYTKPSITYCKNDSTLIDSSNMKVITTPKTPFNIIWKNGLDITNDSTINYWVKNSTTTNLPFTIEYGNNCSVNDVINVIVKPLPVINAIVSQPRVKYEEEIQLDVLTNETLSYNWIPLSNVNIDSIKNPISIIKESTIFIVNVENRITRCKNSDSVYVELIDECTEDFMFIPTGFSPNNDGINDCFSILSPPKLSNFNMVIFDRWSEKVFETYSENECWNGTYKGSDAPTDSYSYIINYTCYNGVLLTKKGVISIIR